MAIIPSSTRFVGIAPSVNLTEKKSNQLNSETQPYTMQDIIDTASSPPAGTAGQIQFNSGSAFAADSNLYWDNTNKRLGIGTDTPTHKLQVNGNISANNSIYLYRSAYGSYHKALYDNSSTSIILDGGTYLDFWSSNNFRARLSNYGSFLIGTTNDNAKLQVKGSGSTSATTALLVQNSSGTQRLKLTDDGVLSVFYINNNPVGSFSNAPSTGNYGMIIGCVTNIGDTAIFTKGNNPTSSALRVTDQNIGASRNHLLVDYVGATGFNLPNGTKTVDASAQVEIVSTTKGFLPPRMTTAEKTAIATPAAGLMVYDTSLNQMSYYNGSAWVNF